MFNWTCPHCNRAQTVVDSKNQRSWDKINVAMIGDSNVGAITDAIGCSNPECGKLTVTFSIRPIYSTSMGWRIQDNARPFYRRQALPESTAKPQPDCVPAPLIEDYVEACLIREASPKAAATLARRCIQGMIRDYCGIKKGTLAKEIEALREALDGGKAPAGVTHESLDAIDHVRSIGNIGAHMEKDIDVIIPVDPGEAQALIELIEMLFAEWYVARDTRQKRLEAISKIGGAKQALKDEAKLALPAPE